MPLYVMALVYAFAWSSLRTLLPGLESRHRVEKLTLMSVDFMEETHTNHIY